MSNSINSQRELSNGLQRWCSWPCCSSFSTPAGLSIRWRKKVSTEGANTIMCPSPLAAVCAALTRPHKFPVNSSVGKKRKRLYSPRVSSCGCPWSRDKRPEWKDCWPFSESYQSWAPPWVSSSGNRWPSGDPSSSTRSQRGAWIRRPAGPAACCDPPWSAREKPGRM